MNILKFDQESTWVEGIVTFWRDRLLHNPALKMCLPTGLTPNQAYAEMARCCKKGQLSFSKTSIYLLDEYGGLSATDPGKSFNMLKERLINHIDLPKDKFHFLNTEATKLDEECKGYETAIGGRFDLVLLGIGLNGHLGLNEPGSEIESGVRKVRLAPSSRESCQRYLKHNQLPEWGLTIGLKQLLAAKEVWLLANGGKKAEIIERTVRGEISNQLPASLLRNHPKCFLFVDGEAGSRL
ncbi:MAG: glucosamine-6-phosphate deaminase [Verrucomicrobiota bacterium]|nr:glucosamine-6-phosphate deaminase [Verrucomicrobiota bacterium]